MYVVAGVTGNTGSVVAKSLLAAKAPVRVIVRDAAKAEAWRQQGAEVAVADLGDQPAVTQALRGATGAYLLLPPRPGSPTPLADNRAVSASLTAAVKAAAVPHVVLLSSSGAQHPDGTGPIQSLHHAEQALAAVTALTSIRAAYFMDNWLGSLGALAQGILPTFVAPTLSIPMVATTDIGRAAAAALLEGPRGQVRLELSGPREYSAEDVAAAISAIIGKPITATAAPLDAVVPTFTSYGMSAAFAELFREMFAGIASGRVAWEGGANRTARGTVTIEDVLRPALAKS